MARKRYKLEEMVAKLRQVDVLVSQCMETSIFAHAATKRELVAKQRPPGWVPPNMFQLPKVLTEAEVVEAEAELKALQRHALEVVDPETES
jgi:hypothetical protein